MDLCYRLCPIIYNVVPFYLLFDTNLGEGSAVLSIVWYYLGQSSAILSIV